MFRVYPNSLDHTTATTIIHSNLKNHPWLPTRTDIGDAWKDPDKTTRSTLTSDLTGHPGIVKICMEVFKKAMPDFNLDPELNYTCSVKAQKYLPGDYMDWHQDSSEDESDTDSYAQSKLRHKGIPVASKSLTFSIPLNCEFDGGYLLVDTGTEIVSHNDLYSAIVFPSSTMHSVETVTYGTRYTLNSWLYQMKETQ